MSHNQNLFCEVFLNGKTLDRNEMAATLAATGAFSVSGNICLSSAMEIEIRNNPRLKGESEETLAVLRNNPISGFMFSALVLEIEPARSSVGTDEYVSAVRELLLQLRESGFTLNVASDLEDELLKGKRACP